MVCVASDGDSRLMKAMRTHSVVQASPCSEWPWFQMNRKTDFIRIRDFVHILVKLKSRLLKLSIILPIGPNTLASKGHLTEATLRFTKDEHGISPSFLDNRNKMNFRSADMMCSKKATGFLISSGIDNCEGTVVYLQLMRSVYMSFADPSLPPLQRVEMLWEELFFLRFWREWIVNTNGDYILSRNFITLNAYMCIELNAHALIQLIVILRDAEECHLFMPWLFSSQPCESLFRLLRSLSSTLCTQFPRNMKAFEAVQGKEFICTVLPENFEIEAAVHSAFKRAANRAVKLKILKSVPKKIPAANLPSYQPENSADDDDEDEGLAHGNEDNDFPFDDDPTGEGDELADVVEDIMVASTGRIGLKTFNNIDVSPTSPFVRVKDAGPNPT
ncbi:Peptide methionine sulfoxide reductase MsrB [Frankliniella fusca]|uniref:Peptide methionine sulfoxide reductase MsrB n=1 Tax=Frankliniella fusca TaxID=407009 RepID=A0AAE1HNI2_9NEOP|nr:Peptide methionine sulfoxide reductase MsrB [Frankliniella fusca]